MEGEFINYGGYNGESMEEINWLFIYEGCMKDECVNNGGRMENHCRRLIYNS